MKGGCSGAPSVVEEWCDEFYVSHGVSLNFVVAVLFVEPTATEPVVLRESSVHLVTLLPCTLSAELGRSARGRFSLSVFQRLSIS